MGDYVNMGTTGAIVIHAVVVGGGRIVQAICNKFTKKRQLLTDVDSNLVDYPTLTWEPPNQLGEAQRAQQELAEVNFEDKSTTPRPQLPQQQQQRPLTTTNSDKVVEAMALLRSMETAQSKSPESETIVHRALLQDEQPTQTAAQIQQGLDKVHRGKRAEEADEDEKTGEEKVFLRKKKHEIENNKTDDTLYNDDDWAQYIVTRMIPNALPERDMNYIADMLPPSGPTRH